MQEKFGNVLSMKRRPTKRAPYAGNSAHIPSSFHALAFFWLDGFAIPAHPQVTQTVGRLRNESLERNKSNAKNANAILKTFGIGIALIQLFDIFIHAATNQLEIIRVISNLVILLWLAVIMLNWYQYLRQFVRALKIFH